MDEDKIVQLFSATGWYGLFKSEEDGNIYEEPIVAFALLRCGIVVPLIESGFGCIEILDHHEYSDLRRLIYKGQIINEQCSPKTPTVEGFSA